VIALPDYLTSKQNISILADRGIWQDAIVGLTLLKICWMSVLRKPRMKAEMKRKRKVYMNDGEHFWVSLEGDFLDLSILHECSLIMDDVYDDRARLMNPHWSIHRCPSK
jgi:hypothetical protein